MEISWWDIGIAGAAAYLALTLMIRLMLLRRNEVMTDLSREIAAEQAKRHEDARAEPTNRDDSRGVA